MDTKQESPARFNRPESFQAGSRFGACSHPRRAYGPAVPVENGRTDLPGEHGGANWAEYCGGLFALLLTVSAFFVLIYWAEKI